MFRSKRLIRRVAVAAASVVAALVVGELALRKLVPSLGSRSFVDLSLGWSSREYRAFDPELDAGQLDVPRILVFGDSYFAAGNERNGVDCRFPAVFQRRVESRVRTAVLASSGWGTDQELLAFVEKGKTWRPDVVVVAFCANNDLSDILSNNQGHRADKPYFLLESGSLELRDPLGRPRPILGATAAEAGFQSFLYDLVRIRLESDAEDTTDRFDRVDSRYLLVRAGRDPTISSAFWEQTSDVLDYSPQLQRSGLSAYIHEELETNSYQWALFEAIVAEFQRQANEIGARLVLMVVPVTFIARRADLLVGANYERCFTTPAGNFSIRAREPVDRLRAISQRLGIPLWDPSREFRERIVAGGLEEECWPQPGNRHFSCLGHEILADLFGDFVADELDMDVR